MESFRHFIAGEPTDAAEGDWLDVIEPATGKRYARLARATATDVNLAVDAAKEAFPDWAATPADERGRWLEQLADAIEADLEGFARAESVDSGKPLALARSVDIPRAVANLRFFAGAIRHEQTEAQQSDDAALNVTLRKPRGVAGLISPWNLPLYLATWKIAPALASGCTAVIKPSELTPATAARLGEACTTVGLPAGVLNIVHGLGGEAGAALVEHPDVPTISFTGGTATGRAINLAAAPRFKKLALEMGGKNPNLVFADTDLEQAVSTSVQAAFRNQGQICLCGSRILVERSIYDAFLDRFLAEASKLKPGDPNDPGTTQGALVSAAHRDKVESYIALGREEGGTIRLGGDRPTDLPERCKDGFFLNPTVITDVDADCRVNREEIFGPVVTIRPFDDEGQALTEANATDYGLAATIWTSDLSRAHRLANEIEAGIVWINCWMLRDLRVPFGGMKQSGMGREGGAEALRFFTEPKSVCIKLERA